MWYFSAFKVKHLGQKNATISARPCNAYETRQSCFLFIFVRFFGLDRAQNTIVFTTDRGTHQ